MTAWATGTVTGHLNLLDALKTFLTTDADLVAASEEWTALKDETIASYTMTTPTVNTPSGGFGATFRDLYLQGPGLAGTDEVHVNIRTYEAPTQGISNWMVQGATGYDGGVPWHRQPNNSWYSNNFLYLTLTNSTIEYWIVANGRRFILICKISGDFYLMHGGLILPYALPSEYPYPLLVSAVTNNINALPTSSVYISNFWSPTNYSPAMFRHRDGQWLYCQAYSSLSTAAYFVTWPWGPIVQHNAAYQHIGHPDGTFALLPATLFSGFDGGNVYGEVDGVFYVPGLSPVVNPLSEDTVQIAAVDYLVVQNVDKTARHDYAAIRLD
jgi:hypothetical protein